VLTEATHLIERGGGNVHLPLDFLLSADVPIQGLVTAGYRPAARLRRRYRDVPVDYADATLVVVAEALAITLSFTLDRKGFRAYKRKDGKGFELVP
jgi:hypothetical protein